MDDGAGHAPAARGHGVTAATVGNARPATVAEVAAAVRASVASTTPLRIVGRGGWLDAGRPVRAVERLHVDALTGIVDYTPGDLTLTARAGSPLAEIDRATRAEGQWLPLLPYGGDAGSLGATIATASAGPLAHAMGLPRDTVLGVEFVTGTGDIVRGGGRVVKNVAGFDLTRLIVGSWGTLGVITEVTVRLRARSERDESIAVEISDHPSELATFVERLRAAPLAPIALELIDTRLSHRLELGDRPVLLARLAGNDDSVAAQRRSLGTLAALRDVDVRVWVALRAEPAGASVFRISGPPSRFAELWQHAAMAASAGGGHACASVRRGVARIVLDGAHDRVRDAVDAAGTAFPIVHERLPAGLWASLSRGATDDRLSRGIKRAFDPRGVLNPGILGEAVA